MKKSSVIFPFLIVVLFAFLFHNLLIAAEPKLEIIAQRTAPIKIEKYEIQTKSASIENPATVIHKIQYKNITREIVEAVQLGILSYDVFNGFQNRIGAVDVAEIMPGMSEKGEWAHPYHEAFMFGTGLVFLVKVKYANGKIWEFDYNEVVSELGKIFPGFKPGAMSDEKFRFLPAQ